MLRLIFDFFYRSRLLSKILSIFILSVLLNAAIFSSAFSQSLPKLKEQLTKQAATENVTPTIESIKAKEKALAEKFASFKEQRLLQTNGVEESYIDALLEILERERVVLYEQKNTIQQIEAADKRLSELKDVGGDIAEQIEAKKALDFLALENLRDELLREQDRAKQLQAALNVSRTLVNISQKNNEKREKQRRQVKEEIESAAGEDKAQLQSDLLLLELGAELSQEQFAAKQLDLQLEQKNIEINNLYVKNLNQRVKSAIANVTFTKADLDAKLDDVATQEIKFRKFLKAAQAREVVAEKQAESFRQRVLNDSDEARKAFNLLENDVASLLYQVSLKSVVIQEKSLAFLSYARSIIEWRYQVLNGTANRKQLADWRDEGSLIVEAVMFTRSESADSFESVRAQIMKRGEDLQRFSAQDQNAVAFVSKLLTDIRYIVRESEDSMQTLDRFQLEGRKLKEDIATITDSRSWGEIVEDLQLAFGNIWNFELTVVDDNPITLGKVFTALALFILGYFVAKLISSRFADQLFKRFHIAKGVAVALESLIFYVLLIIVAIFALQLVNVPLTVFALAGGALAIGIGFGSQNIMNNFISGLIILIERPIRVGDIVEIGTMVGTVDRIGLRSAVIRTGTNINIIMPNSSLLEKDVINWTLVDQKIRVKVMLGVAYGSPTEKVSELLKQAAMENAEILKFPEPLVLLNNFGESTLDFEVHFWINIISSTGRSKIESDVRFRIEQLFREAKINIAFPQRDVHLNSNEPIAVKVLSNS